MGQSGHLKALCIYCCSVAQSCLQLFVTSWTVALPVPLSIGLPRQEYWSGLLFPPPGHLPDSGSNLCLLSQEDALEEETATHSSILAWAIHGQRATVHEVTESRRHD